MTDEDVKAVVRAIKAAQAEEFESFREEFRLVRAEIRSTREEIRSTREEIGRRIDEIETGFVNTTRNLSRRITNIEAST